MSETMNIYKKMARITAELRTVAKNLDVETGKGKGYKAVAERDVIDAVKPLEDKYGVYSYPSARRIIESQTLESENTYGGNTTKKTTFFSRMETVYRFVNTDNPTEFIEVVSFSEGIDSQDKGSGKAMTYADKYALMKAYKISTGEDPDQTASEEERYNTVAHICSDCGCTIKSTVGKGGAEWSAANIAAYSQKRFGHVLCPDCQRGAGASEN